MTTRNTALVAGVAVLALGTASLGLAAGRGPGGFADVDAADRHAADIAWLKEQGITMGCGEVAGTVTFCPDDPTTRAQMASFLRRLAESGVVDAASIHGMDLAGLEEHLAFAGPQGDPGPQGEPGRDGAVGAEGPVGPVGPEGAVGAVGAEGETGPAGPKGPHGENGETGATGPEGPQGPKGDTGATGPKGDTGATGPEGPQGPKGDTGATGPQGEVGPEGPQGPVGTGLQLYFGDTLLGPVVGAGQEGMWFWDAEAGRAARASIAQRSLYWSGPDCTGTAYSSRYAEDGDMYGSRTEIGLGDRVEHLDVYHEVVSEPITAILNSSHHEGGNCQNLRSTSTWSDMLELSPTADSVHVGS